MHRPPTDEVLERAQSSPIGVVLILGMTLSASIAIVVFGGAALESSQEDSRIGQAEQALTQFDSKAAQVSLGDSESQTVTLGTNGGSYRVDDQAGTLRIYHEDWNGTNATEDDEFIFGNETHAVPLGAVLYQTGDTTIAYQGGGVWRKDKGGGVTMISPPEFHYREATLTFPIVRVGGSGSVSGNARGRISSVETARNVYPDIENVSTDHSDQYSGDDRIYSNPVQEGNMTVEIESEYCEAWRTYFLERTEGKVTDCGDNNTVAAQIVALGTQGEFDITDSGEVRIRGREDGHSMHNFKMEFRDDNSGSKSVFNNLGWDMTGTNDEGDKFGIYFRRDGGANDLCDDPDPTLPVDMTIYFNNASTGDYNAFRIPSSDTQNAFNVTCEGGQQVLKVDLLDSDRNATYADIEKKPNSWDPPGELYDNETFSGHGDREPRSFVEGNDDVAPLDLVIQHYMSELGNGDLEISEQNNALLHESSTGDMEYEGGGQVVTFLHVTENRIEVELN